METNSLKSALGLAMTSRRMVSMSLDRLQEIVDPRVCRAVEAVGSRPSK